MLTLHPSCYLEHFMGLNLYQQDTFFLVIHVFILSFILDCVCLGILQLGLYTGWFRKETFVDSFICMLIHFRSYKILSVFVMMVKGHVRWKDNIQHYVSSISSRMKFWTLYLEWQVFLQLLYKSPILYLQVV